jgi:gluconolactonase
MGFFAPPELIETEVFAEVPQALRKTSASDERLAAGKGLIAAGSFLEGPAFDRNGDLYCVDIPYGRIFRISPQGDFTGS